MAVEYGGGDCGGGGGEPAAGGEVEAGCVGKGV